MRRSPPLADVRSAFSSRVQAAATTCYAAVHPRLAGDEEEKEAVPADMVRDWIAFLRKTRDQIAFLARLCVGSGSQIRV